jgi:hypothetical protein
VEEGGGDGLLVQAQAGADGCDADRMRDEGLARPSLLSLVRRRGETEGARDELDVEIRAVRGELGEQPLEELLVLLARLQRRDCLSVLGRFWRESVREERPLRDRSDAFHGCISPLSRRPAARARACSVPERL